MAWQMEKMSYNMLRITWNNDNMAHFVVCFCSYYFGTERRLFFIIVNKVKQSALYEEIATVALLHCNDGFYFDSNIEFLHVGGRPTIRWKN